MRILAIALLAPALAVAQEAQEKKKVMCTLPVLSAIAVELGGGDFEVTALSKPDQDPHFVSPTPTLMKKVREADLFIELGMQLEIWAEDVANGSGNTRIQKGGKGRVVASTGIPREEIPPVVSRAEGDIHPEGNPHLWCGPLHCRQLADNIAAALIAASPDRKDAVEARLKKFKDRVDEAMFGPDLIKAVGIKPLLRKTLDGSLAAWLEEKKLGDKTGGWFKKAAPLRGQKVVEFHRVWVYFAKTFGFEIVGSIEPKPGIQPGPRHLQELRDLIKAKSVKVLIVETYQDASTPQSIAEATGAKVAVVATQPAEAGDYVKLIDSILDKLVEAAK
jgi:ABC-type Zn uptake system ZnuABC Zn-binding protein ZnuA